VTRDQVGFEARDVTLKPEKERSKPVERKHLASAAVPFVSLVVDDYFFQPVS